MIYPKAFNTINVYEDIIQKHLPKNSDEFKAIQTIFANLRKNMVENRDSLKRPLWDRFWQFIFNKSELSICIDQIQVAISKVFKSIKEEKTLNDIKTKLEMQPMKVSFVRRFYHGFTSSKVIGIRNKIFRDLNKEVVSPSINNGEIQIVQEKEMNKSLNDFSEIAYNELIDSYLTFIKEKHKNDIILYGIRTLLASQKIKHKNPDPRIDCQIKKTSVDTYMKFIDLWLIDQFFQTILVDFKEFIYRRSAEFPNLNLLKETILSLTLESKMHIKITAPNG